ncbi:MAG: PKD domain-containing protein, partial [Thermoplasmata archaeon]|nr:PKD domain-containing protein [Thermoplasmata archaeon]
GRAVTFTATMIGGTGNATYIWFVNNSVVTGVPGPVLILAPAGGGRYTVSVEATDAAGVTSFAGPVTWSVSASVGASPTSTSPGMDLSTGLLFLAAGVGLGAAVVFLAFWLRRPSAPTRRR